RHDPRPGAGRRRERGRVGEDARREGDGRMSTGRALRLRAVDDRGGEVKVGLKIWRYDPERGERALREYEVDAPEWVTLLDVLDLIKDRQDGTLAYRKSCRMMICGSCGMRMDGAAVLACKMRMYDMVQAGHVPV